MNYLEPKTTARLLSSPPKHKNPELQEKINENKNELCLILERSNLTNEDMEIVAYYLLQNNKVSNVVFGFSLFKRIDQFCYDLF
jgi:hypothetical protein